MARGAASPSRDRRPDRRSRRCQKICPRPPLPLKLKAIEALVASCLSPYDGPFIFPCGDVAAKVLFLRSRRYKGGSSPSSPTTSSTSDESGRDDGSGQAPRVHVEFSECTMTPSSSPSTNDATKYPSNLLAHEASFALGQIQDAELVLL